MDTKQESDDKPIVRLDGLHNIIDKYDAFILDQFGVMHNGAEAYPGAVECYNKLHEAGKKIIILSNLGERSAAAIASLGSLGFDPDKLTGFVCSGEEAWHYMHGTKAGARCTVLTWAKGADAYISGLDLILSDIDEADFILSHGTDLICTAAGTPPVVTGFKQSGDPAPYAALLQRAAARGLEMVVANPDIVAIQPDGSKGYMPGAIARAYEGYGGRATCFGKPHLRSFESCVKLAAAAGVPPARIVHVGDSAEALPPRAGRNAEARHARPDLPFERALLLPAPASLRPALTPPCSCSTTWSAPPRRTSTSSSSAAAYTPLSSASSEPGPPSPAPPPTVLYSS